MDQSNFSLAKSRHQYLLNVCLTFTVIIFTVTVFCLFKLFVLILSST